jgi:hypothetical protein
VAALVLAGMPASGHDVRCLAAECGVSVTAFSHRRHATFEHGEDDAMHVADYIVPGFLIALMLLTAAKAISR